ncbi:MAG: carboxymuconolactone decarboxylase family protein [Solirubrobacteraceae bacterium]
MTSTIPAHRMQLVDVAPRQYGAMFRFASSVELDHVLNLLIEIRASQINGCAFCLDMHWKDARAAGESEERLYMLSAWRESSLYSERERAALELCEAMTQIAGRGVPDDVWERATAAFGEEELAQVVYAIVVINSWNRLQITTQAEPGHYYPGMFYAPASAADGR